MSESAGFACPHCSAVSPQLTEFCSSCGLAMPALSRTGPSIVGGRQTAQTAAGQKLQSEELFRTATRAARSLMSTGVICLLIAGLSGFTLYTAMSTGRRLRPGYELYESVHICEYLAVGTIFLGMYFWAKYSPLTATIVGLVTYLIHWCVTLVINATLLKNNANVNTATGYGFMRIFLVIVLANGINAAWKHRKLELEQQKAAGPLPVVPLE